MKDQRQGSTSMLRRPPYLAVVVDELEIGEVIADTQHEANRRGSVADGPGTAHRDDLLAWFGDVGRDLPWRRTRDPWTILVSELMLQQTQVARVVDRLARFADRFPTPVACAAAPVGDVIDEWKGLGYNRRAVNLHRAATVIVDEHGGAVPDDLDALLALPGIGAYTARAVLAFAFEREVGVVDTNIARVLARWEGVRLRPAEVQRLADAEVIVGEGWAWNQALMELGALLCRPDPRCDDCPVTARCSWQRAGRPEPDPSVGSAKVSKGQSRFEGSDRQGRGRLVDALRTGEVDDVDLESVMGWPDDRPRAERVAVSLLEDGLAVHDPTSNRWRLPT